MDTTDTNANCTPTTPMTSASIMTRSHLVAAWTPPASAVGAVAGAAGLVAGKRGRDARAFAALQGAAPPRGNPR